MLTRRHILKSGAAILAWPATSAFGQTGPLQVEINQGVIEPMPIAITQFLTDTTAQTAYAEAITQVIANDLVGTGLFRQIPTSAYVSTITNFTAPIRYEDWQTINAQALVTGQVQQNNGQFIVQFQLFDVFANQPLGDGMQFSGPTQGWRRMAHAIADQVYERITGEGGYFDTRVVFVHEEGPKNNRLKSLAIMDYDGANVQFLTDNQSLVLAPRMNMRGDQLLYTSYESGFPQVYLMDIATTSRRPLQNLPDGNMTFAPRFSPDGRSVVFSVENNGNSDIYIHDLTGGTNQRLTSGDAIETAPSFSPDGRMIVFESDRRNGQQIYTMSSTGDNIQRISRGSGRYGTPVWSPRGDLIAFTKSHAGRFHIGVMRSDGSEERLLTASFLDEGPTWAPNGRVIMFTRQAQGGDPALFAVDISGRNLRRMPLASSASDPAWGPLLP